MSLKVVALQSSFEMVVQREPQLARRFYEIFFKRYPAAQRLFGRHSAAAQEKMLTDALVAMMEHLEDAPWLTTTLKQLGAKHAGYGVTDEMYDWVGRSLLATLAEVAGPDWSRDLEAAWAEAYGAIAGLMQTGDAEAEQSLLPPAAIPVLRNAADSGALSGAH